MKFKFPGTMLLIIPLGIFGQVYHPFPDSNCVWTVGGEKFFIKGDTMLNSVKYQKYFNTIDSTLQSGLQLNAFVRNDSPAKKIYMRKTSTSPEYLIYDFALKLKDTTIVYCIPMYTTVTAVVQFKDSIPVSGGQYRKRLTLSTKSQYFTFWTGQETWIEGVGSDLGPLNGGFSASPIFDTSHPPMICQIVNGKSVYVHPSFPNCLWSPPVGLTELRSNDSFHVFSDPGNKKIVVKTTSNEDTGQLNLRVIGITGQVLSSHPVNGSYAEIDIKDLSEGIYLIQLLNGTTAVNAAKITR
jgi:hypothetical protein